MTTETRSIFTKMDLSLQEKVLMQMLSKVPSNGWDEVHLQLKSTDGTIMNGVLTEEMILCAALEIVSARKIAMVTPEYDDDEGVVGFNEDIRGGHLLMEIEGVHDQETQDQVAVMNSILNGPKGILMSDDYSSKHGVETIFIAVHNGGGPVLIRKDPSGGEMPFKALVDGGVNLVASNSYEEVFPEENFLAEMANLSGESSEAPKKDSDDDIPF